MNDRRQPRSIPGNSFRRSATIFGSAVESGNPRLRAVDKIELRLYEVDGNLVRTAYDVDFTMGGHRDAGYDFIPKGEIWLDSSNAEEIDETAFHEVAEWMIMRRFGLGYDDAHEVAAECEAVLRRKLTQKQEGEGR